MECGPSENQSVKQRSKQAESAARYRQKIREEKEALLIERIKLLDLKRERLALIQELENKIAALADLIAEEVVPLIEEIPDRK